MMDVATIVLTASAITLVLQIIVIVLVLDTRKKFNQGLHEEKPSSLDPRDMRKPKDVGSRTIGKPPQDHKNRAPVPPHNIEHVERSLRDINLRLKNAERDQEKERQRIKDTLSPTLPKKYDPRKPKERDDNFRRNDRPRHEFHQHRNAEPQRQQREERGFLKNNHDVRERIVPSVIQPPDATAAIAPPPPPLPQPPAEPVFEALKSQPEIAENLQHGRKFIVKRRILSLEEEKANGQNDAEPIAAASPSPNSAGQGKDTAEIKHEPVSAVDQAPSIPEIETPESPTITFGR